MEPVYKAAHRTPLLHSHNLSRTFGGQVYLKAECLQRAGSFKLRGAANKLASLSAAELTRGVITASAGNHAQGLALAAKAAGVAATVVIPEMVPAAEKDGQVIGFGIALPDLNVVFRKNRSGHLLPVLPRLLWALKRRKIRRARILLLGVIPEFRGKAVDAMLYHWIWTRSGERGIYWGEAGWILEDNPAMNAGLEKMTFRVYKTYRLYDRAI